MKILALLNINDDQKQLTQIEELGVKINDTIEIDDDPKKSQHFTVVDEEIYEVLWVIKLKIYLEVNHNEIQNT